MTLPWNGLARYGVVVTAVGLLTACGGGGEEQADPESDRTASVAVSGTVTVLAAASLTGPFEALEERVEADHPGLDVVLSFGPSSALAEQVISGAPADVLATADTRTMGTALDAGAVEGESVVFARNSLALTVPAGNPGRVESLNDLAREELVVALCEPQVPCGAAAEELLSLTGVDAQPDTLTTDVKEATSLVALGEVDAALIYRTDATAEGDAVEVVDVPEAADVVNDYPIAALAEAPNPAAAAVVVDAVTGADGAGVLEDAGFIIP